MALGDNSRIDAYVQIVKAKVLGANNERLDFVMDSFYKLEGRTRQLLLAFFGLLLAGIVISAVFLYLHRVQALEDELNDTFSALSELKALKAAEAFERKRFDKLVKKVKSKTQSLEFKPFFERLSRKFETQIKGMDVPAVDMDSQNPLSEKLQLYHASMRIPQISVPRFLNFLVAIEKANLYLRIQDLKVSGVFGNKLYFDIELTVRGYKSR